jgi:hypothetical protein
VLAASYNIAAGFLIPEKKADKRFWFLTRRVPQPG